MFLGHKANFFVGSHKQNLGFLFIYIKNPHNVYSKMYDVRNDLRVYVLFNSISVVSGRCEGDKERLYAMEPRLWLRRIRLQLELEIRK